MVIELYSHWISTNCTMVQLLSHHIGCEVDVKEICVFPTEENMSDRLQANVNLRSMQRLNFFTGNPGVRVPVLVIDSKKITTDTKDILKYLAENYCDDDSLYPINKREEIDFQVCFAVDTVNKIVAEVYYEDIVDRKPQVLEKIEKVNEALEKVEEYLGEHEFICGGAPTIADFCIAVITSTLEVVNHDMSNFPKIMSHLRICMELIRGWDEVGQFRATRYGQWYRAALEAAESGGCPYFPKRRDTVDDTAPYSSDIELYSFSLFPKSIMIQLLARTLELDLVIKKIDLCHKEENEESRKEADENWKLMLKHLYFSNNEEADAPLMLVDEGTVIVETGNILKYMVEKQESTEISQQLYPSDSVTRSLVEVQLTFALDLDALVLETYVHIFENALTKHEIDQTKVAKIKNKLKKLEEVLEQSDFITGNNLTIADFAYAVTLSVLAAVDPNIYSEFEKVSLYLKICKETIKDWEDVGESGLTLWEEWYNDCVDWTQNGNCPYYSG